VSGSVISESMVWRMLERSGQHWARRTVWPQVHLHPQSAIATSGSSPVLGCGHLTSSNFSIWAFQGGWLRLPVQVLLKTSSPLLALGNALLFSGRVCN
jgi:hypothetical protein